MRVIDLLNKIAKGEEVPKKIKLDGKEYEFNKTYEQYHQTYFGINLLEHISDYNYSGLNDEVEIIEEVEDKEYEDIEIYDYADNHEVMYPNTIANNFVHLNEDLKTITGAIKYILERLEKGE